MQGTEAYTPLENPRGDTVIDTKSPKSLEYRTLFQDSQNITKKVRGVLYDVREIVNIFLSDPKEYMRLIYFAISGPTEILGIEIQNFLKDYTKNLDKHKK